MEREYRGSWVGAPSILRETKARAPGRRTENSLRLLNIQVPVTCTLLTLTLTPPYDHLTKLSFMFQPIACLRFDHRPLSALITKQM